MRMYDVDIVLHLSCPARNEQEAEDCCLSRLREGAYNQDEVEMNVSEVKRSVDEVVEMCPHCGHENVYYDIPDGKMVAVCDCCERHIVLCDKCKDRTKCNECEYEKLCNKLNKED